MDEDRMREIAREEIAKANARLADGAALGIGEMTSALELMLLKSGLTERYPELGEVFDFMRKQEQDLKAELGIDIPDDISDISGGNEGGEQ